jgi:GT2 family glycosyltransferase
VGANRNCAVAAATGDIVAFLDDDGMMLPDFMSAAIERMRAAEQRYGAGRVIVSGRSLIEHGELIGAYDQSFLGHQTRPHASGEGLRAVALNAVIFPAQVFLRVRFDSQLVYGYEEVDLASRAVAAGFVIVDCPEAINYHESPPRGLDDHHEYAEASRLHVTLRRHALTDRAPLRALAFAVIAPIHLVAADVKRLGLRGVRSSTATLALAARMLWCATRSGNGS